MVLRPQNLLNYTGEIHAPDLLRYIMVTKLGGGPRQLVDTDSEKHSLLDQNGLPLPPVKAVVPEREPGLLLTSLKDPALEFWSTELRQALKRKMSTRWCEAGQSNCVSDDDNQPG